MAEVAQHRLQRAGLDVSRTEHEMNTLPGYARLFLTIEAKETPAPSKVTLIANLWLSEWACLNRTGIGRFVTTWTNSLYGLPRPLSGQMVDYTFDSLIDSFVVACRRVTG